MITIHLVGLEVFCDVCGTSLKSLDPIGVMHSHFIVSMFAECLNLFALIGEERNKKINMHKWESVHKFRNAELKSNH